MKVKLDVIHSSSKYKHYVTDYWIATNEAYVPEGSEFNRGVGLTPEAAINDFVIKLEKTSTILETERKNRGVEIDLDFYKIPK